MFFTPKTEDRYYKLFHAFTAVSLIPLLYCFERSGGHFASTTKFLLEVSICFLSSASVLIYANFSLYWQKVYMDELTDVPNRRALNEKLISLRGNYFLAMIDVDHFKQFNDTHGHEQGDTVLRFVASHFSKTPGAEVFRYGGEEFCLVVKNDSLIEAAEAVDENRKSLAKREFTIRSPRQIRLKKGKSFRNKTSGPGIKVHLTVSGGIAGPLTEFTNNDDVLRAADKALYHAKEKGRNQVAMSEKKSIVSLSDKKAS
jgi:diguanylate cyclase (GGDEF)-like protein